MPKVQGSWKPSARSILFYWDSEPLTSPNRAHLHEPINCALCLGSFKPVNNLQNPSSIPREKRRGKVCAADS